MVRYSSVRHGGDGGGIVLQGMVVMVEIESSMVTNIGLSIY